VPGSRACSSAAAAQCVVTRRPSSSPAAAAMKAPVHTAATRRHRLAAAATKATRPWSAPAALEPIPPGSTRVSIRSPRPGNGTVPSSRPLSVRTGPPCADATRTRYPPRLPTAAAASPALVNTSYGPATSIDCTPSKATNTIGSSLTDPTLAMAHRWRQRHIPHTFGHTLSRPPPQRTSDRRNVCQRRAHQAARPPAAGP
jgi:hypothetical protein